MASHANITKHARYSVRNGGGNWFEVPPETAKAIVSAPAGQPFKIKMRRRTRKGLIVNEIDVHVLKVMPPEYTSEADHGSGILIWSWNFGAVPCDKISAKIDDHVREDVDRAQMFGNPPPRYAGLFLTLRDRLCSNKKPKKKPGERDARKALQDALRRDR